MKRLERFQNNNSGNESYTIVIPLLEQYSCISAHALDDDRLGGKYHMVDDDTKLGMALSMQLQITPNMSISQEVKL